MYLCTQLEKEPKAGSGSFPQWVPNCQRRKGDSSFSGRFSDAFSSRGCVLSTKDAGDLRRLEDTDETGTCDDCEFSFD
jgi:hypothetical protein